MSARRRSSFCCTADVVPAACAAASSFATSIAQQKARSPAWRISLSICSSSGLPIKRSRQGQDQADRDRDRQDRSSVALLSATADRTGRNGPCARNHDRRNRDVRVESSDLGCRAGDRSSQEDRETPNPSETGKAAESMADALTKTRSFQLVFGGRCQPLQAWTQKFRWVGAISISSAIWRRLNRGRRACSGRGQS